MGLGGGEIVLKRKREKQFKFLLENFTKPVWESDGFGESKYEENGYSYQIATPEKALCDKLYTIPPVKNLAEFSALLFEDLRIDENEFKKLDMDAIEKLAPLYRTNNLKFLVKFIRRMR